MEHSKAYTDLGQSIKLAEFLPLESADTYYWCGDELRIGGHKAMDTEHDIPCWSLAALLDVIPQEILGGDYIINITEGCDNKWVLTYDYCNNGTPSFYGLYGQADNLIDACYELLLNLYKHKMLSILE